MSEEPAIDIRELSKAYLVYKKPADRLKQALAPKLYSVMRPVANLTGKTLTTPMYYDPFWALRPLTLTVRRGETLGVIGRNGSGKSTLLQLLCGTLTPTTGEARTNGRIAALLELGSGFNPEYTGRENIHLNASILGLTPQEVDQRIDEILAFADIGEHVDQPTKTYSSGMTMRLAFSVIAHVDADILVVDEALAVGDAYFQQKCMRWLRKFRERGTVLFCGHDTSAVINLCQRAIWLDKGQAKLIGPARDVCEAYTAAVNAQAMGIPEPEVRHPSSATSEAGLATLKVPVKEGAARSLHSKSIGVLPQIVQLAEPSDHSASYGSGDAQVIAVSMTRENGEPLHLIYGGEKVRVTVAVKANVTIENPIIGFFVKDRLGQPLFGDNTFDSYVDHNILLEPGKEAIASFVFSLPLLLTGTYIITAAVASGTLNAPVMHDWLHDALSFDVMSPLLTGVLVGIAMEKIEMKVIDEEERAVI
ncbi:ABC transporter ATP-binding protein [Bradyrhizobium iriomotense]|uniref:ABC transporter ATP-binding protein n=1 Tax=Bradyrhizobium iriomotense TaxID=441950 RepID=A0ABQ6B1V9_9BRAD|nr:ABC transporter ATP-binding protein [Bradyrhizobium iriomotense]GLR87675.1 ABC transporter ATP-binding protein [Bradyrhizobium iriomotense]